MNIDANPLYEESLKAIKEVVGGHYFIGAITDFEGEIEISTGAHHYWASALPDGDTYWQGQQGVQGAKFTVPATTLDALNRQLNLQPPFILKLDVQGLEERVLRGATEVLGMTDIVICEAGIHEFHDIDVALVQRGFVFYDALAFLRHHDGTLLQFYPVYISNTLREMVTPTAGWEEHNQVATIKHQERRREKILKDIEGSLQRFRSTMLRPPEHS